MVSNIAFEENFHSNKTKVVLTISPGLTNKTGIGTPDHSIFNVSEAEFIVFKLTK